MGFATNLVIQSPHQRCPNYAPSHRHSGAYLGAVVEHRGAVAVVAGGALGVFQGVGEIFDAKARKHSGATLGLDMFAFEDERGGDVLLVLAMYWGGKVQRGYALDSSLYYELVKQIHECRTSAASDTCREGPHSDQPSPEEPR